MSLLHADLPSDDEADDDYDPSRDDKADEDGQTKAKGKNTGTKRRRGSAAYPGAPEAETPDAELNENDVAVETPASLAKKGKVDQLWAQLNKGKQVAQPAKTLLPSTIAEEAQTQSLVQPPLSKQPFSLASICRPVQKAQKAGSDTDWKRQLGIKTQPEEAAVKQESKQRAVAAAVAAAAAQDKAGPKTVTEVRRFAGKDIEYKRAATEKDGEASVSQDIRKGGLDALLGSLQQTRKVNVLDKSRMDWGDFKSTDVKVDEELEGYKKSGDKYLDKVDFLKRAELRQYEKERDQRLSQDMRSRGRL